MNRASPMAMTVLLLALSAGAPVFDVEPTHVRRGAMPRPKEGPTPERGYPGVPGKKANPKREQQKAAKRARKKAKRGW